MAESSFDKSTSEMIGKMEKMFKQAPPLPPPAREFIVAITPWFAIIIGIIGILGSLAGLGILTFLSPLVALGGGVGLATGSIVVVLLSLVASVLLAAAFPGTNAKKASGWKFLFYSEAVSVISSIITISVVGVVSALIGFYILFQIKSYYK